LKRKLGDLALVLASSALTLAAAEIALETVDKPSSNTGIRAGWKYQGTDGHVNQLGYRGQPIRYSDDDIVVVLLGDSQVESTACAAERMPERLLERHLDQLDPRFKVFSVGSGGYGNDQEYLALREYFGQYRADAIILWETFDNDVWNNLFPTHWPRDGAIKPTFWLEHGTLIGPNYGMGELVKGPARTKIGALVDRWFGPQNGLDKGWERHLPRPYEPLSQYEGKYLTDWDPDDPSNRNPYLRFENLKNEKSHFSVHLYPRSERMQYGLDLMRELLGRTSAVASEHGSEFYIFDTLNPDEQRMLKAANTDDIVVHAREGGFYRTSFTQTRANMAYAHQGFTALEIPIRLEVWKVSDVDRHLNCAANDQVMHDLAKRIVERMPIRKPAP
jgi:hypothetical protein